MKIGIRIFFKLVYSTSCSFHFMVYTPRVYSNGSLTFYGNIQSVLLEKESSTSATNIYEKVTSGTCKHIYTIEACKNAAQQFGLGDNSAVDDGQYGVSDDPPYCYYEDGRVKFNHYGRNTGNCSSYDQCLCINDYYQGIDDNFNVYQSANKNIR